MALEHADPTTANAINRAHIDLTQLQPGQSFDSIAQRDLHDAYNAMTPEQYNAFLQGVGSQFQGSQADVIRHYGQLELTGDNQSQQATVNSAFQGDKTALDKVGFHGDDAPKDFTSLYGKNAPSPNDAPISLPSENGTVISYADGSSRGFHYQIGEDGKPVQGPDGKPVIDGVNETDKNGISRKLILGPDGKWISGGTSQPWGVADDPSQPGSRQIPVDNFNPDPNSKASVGDNGSLQNQLTPSDDPNHPAPRPANLLPVEGPNPGLQVNKYPNGTTETKTNGQPTRYETQNGTVIEKHDDGKWWVHDPGKENWSSAGVPSVDKDGKVTYSGTGMMGLSTYTLGADN